MKFIDDADMKNFTEILRINKDKLNKKELSLLNYWTKEYNKYVKNRTPMSVGVTAPDDKVNGLWKAVEKDYVQWVRNVMSMYL